MAELLSFCQLGVLLKCAQRSWYYLPSASLHVRFLRKCYHCQSVLCNLYWTQWPCWLSTLHGNSSLQPGCCSWTLGSSKKRCRVFFIMFFFFINSSQRHSNILTPEVIILLPRNTLGILSFFFQWWAMN